MAALIRSLAWLSVVLVIADRGKPAGGTIFSVRHDLVGWIGGVVLLTGLAFHVWSNLSLARVETTRLQPGRMVVAGPYRYVRNPIYLAGFVLLLGAHLLYAPWRWLSLVAILLAIAVFNVVVRVFEEPGLRRRFGADYDDYCRRVPRWIPRLH